MIQTSGQEFDNRRFDMRIHGRSRRAENALNSRSSAEFPAGFASGIAIA
jgi:hypothetical protein